jgi:hypothetical protein
MNFSVKSRQNESKFEDETLVLRKKQDLWREILHNMRCLEGQFTLIQIRDYIYSGISGEAVRDSRIVVAFSIRLTFDSALIVNLGSR